MRSSQPPIGRCGNYHLTEKQNEPHRYMREWHGEGARVSVTPSDSSATQHDALQSPGSVHFRRSSEIITCKSSQWCLSLSEVQMRHRFASDVAMWGEPRDSWTWSEMSPVISKTATAGPVARTREVPGRVHFLARCGGCTDSSYRGCPLSPATAGRISCF